MNGEDFIDIDELTPEEAALFAGLLREEGVELPPLAGIPRRANRAEHPLSFSQRRFWFLDQLSPGNSQYNIAMAVRLEGRLDAAALAAGLSEIVRRHEVLRGSFQAVLGEPVQEIAPAAPVPLPLVDLGALPAAERADEGRRLAREEHRRPFDLARGPLLRVLLVRLAAEEHVALATMHHIVSDAWSIRVLVRELGVLYVAFSTGRPSPLPELEIQYADFACWQRQRLSGELLERGLAYWRERLGDSPPALELPADRPRPARRTARGARRVFAIPVEVARELRGLCRRREMTPFMLLLAAFAALLHRYTGQEDLTVGAPIAGRDQVQTEGLIGLFINTLVLRASLAGEPRFGELLERVREVALGAFAHQELPFDKLVEEIRPEREVQGSPLFRVTFSVQSASPARRELRGLAMSLPPAEVETTNFDLGLEMTEGEGQLTGSMTYSTELFDATTIERLARHYAALLAAVAEDPSRELAVLPLVTAAERHQLLLEWNESGEASAPDACLHSLFAEQARRSPSEVAVVCEGACLTYAELDRRSNRLAHLLRAWGVGPEVRVALCCERSIEMVVAILGILKAGGAYVPLDPSSPRERLASLLERLGGECGPPPLLTQARLSGRLPAHRGPVLQLDADWPHVEAPADEAPPSSATPGNAAYVLHTSGSTGLPKGVVVEHRQIVNYLRAVTARLALAPGASAAMLQPLTVDSCKTALYPPLLSGGTLHLISEARALDGGALADYFERHRVDLLKIAPSHLAALQSTVAPETLQPRGWLVIGGEASRWEWSRGLATLRDGCRVFNHYGPTEATVGMLAGRVVPGLSAGASETTPLGRPLAGASVYLLDRAMKPVAAGIAGELYIGGACVARGYEGRADLTAERFVPDPFATVAGGRLYRTGDLARYLADGRVEFLGRFDHQIKIRGFRIELGEVVAALVRHPGVREAVVTAFEDAGGTKKLAAYVLPRGTIPPDPADLQRFAKKQLPAYMVPTTFVVLAEFPRTPHGKLDRKLLPAPERILQRAGEAPRNPIEEMLVEVWTDLLRIERVGVHDNFFDVGGHSLLATRVVSRVRDTFGVDLAVVDLFERPTVAMLAAALAERMRSGAGALPPLGRADRSRPLPLSFAQQRLWFLDQLQPWGVAYNIPTAVRLEGDLHVPALEAGLSEVVRRHEALRTTFESGGGEPVQVIHASRPVRLPVLDLSGLSAAERERESLRLVRWERRLPFDLQAGPLLRCALLRLGRREHLLLLTLHHIVSDGWSMAVLVGELITLCAAFSQQRPSPLPELAIQYADYAAWQRQWLAGESLQAELGYWRERLGDRPPVLELPTDRPRPVVQTFAGASQPVRIGPAAVAGLRALARQQGATLFMTLLAGFVVLLQRYSGQDDLVVGTPVAGRNRVEIEDLIGFFVNMLVLRLDLKDAPGSGLVPAELLARVRETALSAYAHQDLPFEKLVVELQRERDLSRTPLFQVVFALQNAPGGEPSVSGLAFRRVEVESTTAKFDLTLSITEAGSGLAGSFEYNRDLFDRSTVCRMAQHLTVLLEALSGPSAGAIAELPLLSIAERQELLLEWNDTVRACPQRPLVHELFSEHARRRPEATVISAPGGRLSYGEVEVRSNRLAHHLRDLGVGPEVLVALCMERTLERVVGIVAVLKAGGAYVSLDPTYPRERLSFLLEDAEAPVLLTESRFLEALPETSAAVLCLDGAWDGIVGEERWAPASGVHPENLAYVVYTSGSTGRPKGVEIPHAGLMNLVRWHQGLYGVVTEDRGTQIASPAFDASIWELWPYLSAGASVHVPDEETRLSSAGMVRWWSEQGITLAYLMTPLAEGVLEEEIPEDLALRVRALIIGGDRLHRGPAPGVGFRLMNHYGPAEYTVTSTVVAVPEQGQLTGIPSIGRPVDNTRIYVLDRRGQPVPAGVPGELYVAGLGLARGYMRRPDLTAEKFVPDPFAPLWGETGGRMYRTADLVRWLPDGDLDFLGRLDHQVKIRGLRIELGEIETVLSQHPGLREVAVLVREDRPGAKRLTAYVVAVEDTPAVEELRAFLLDKLPEYMVPAAFVVLDALPLTPNGKVDRRALPAPQWTPEGELVAPRTPVEELLAGIWKEVLGIEQVSVHDNFFELGGHSLLATRVVSRVRSSLSVELSLRSLFEMPTIAALAESLEGKGAGQGGSDLDKIAQALEQLENLSEEDVLALLENEPS